MRIVQITSHLNVGGVTSYVVTLSRALAKRGHAVVVASGGGTRETELADAGVAHWRVPLATSVEFGPSVWRAGRQLADRLRGEPVQLVHAHTRVAQVAAARLSRAARVPVVTTWHGFFRPNLGRRLWPCGGDRALAISEPVRRHLIEELHLSAERVRLIPHGIDPRPFEAPADPGAQRRLRAAWGLPGAGPVIGTVCRLVAAKGVDRLIRSLPRVRAGVPGTSLLLVGDGPERGRLEALAGACGVGAAVRFIGTLPETREALSVMDVFVFLPADREGFGLVLLEAMASARPIVAVRQGGGAVWVLEESGVGRLVAPDDVDELAGAIAALLRDPETARRAAEQARAVVTARYSLDRMVDQIEAVYRELC